MNTLFFFAKSIWIHYMLRDLSLNWLSYSRNHYEYTIFCEINMNSLSVSLNHLKSIFLLNHYKITICLAISLWKHYLLREFSMNSLSAEQFLFEFTIFFANSPWIPFFPRNHYKFTILFPKSLWIHYFFAKSIWILYLLRDFTLNSLFFPEITINTLFFAK